MILIADSGSTKTNWLLSDGKDFKLDVITCGFNPFFHDTAYVLNEISKSADLEKYAAQVKTLKFYGSGCSSNGRKKIIADAFAKFFPNADVMVDHDMLGAAIAACFDEPGLVAILGTGSNIAFWDGIKISPTNHGLGYILGDEGSGSFYGRKLISHFLYGVMPQELSKLFYEEYKMDKEKAIDNVYHKPNANVYLASFAKFLSVQPNHPYVQNLLRNGLTEFVDTSVLAYSQHKQYPVHFIGSIAFNFKSILEDLARQKGFKVGKVIVKPVEELLTYFLQKKN